MTAKKRPAKLGKTKRPATKNSTRKPRKRAVKLKTDSGAKPVPARGMVKEAEAALRVTPPQNLADYAAGVSHQAGKKLLGRVDVAIVGGGPGGSTLAALLAKQGRKVAIVERNEFPRFRIGESLLPFSIDIWKKAGVLQKIHDQGYCVKRGARFVIDETLEDECFWFRNGLDGDHSYAFQVQRGPFDKLLLDHARELGVKVFQPVGANNWRVEPDKAVLDTDKGELHAQVLCDVSGRWTFMSAKQGQRRMHPAHRKITCFAHFKDVLRCEQDPNNIIIVRFGDSKKGWFWLIPFSDGTTSVGVVTDAAYFRESGQSPREFFEASIASSRSMAPRMREAIPCCDVLAESDFSYASDRQVGDRWLKIGDAGVFVDPVFSSGVFLSTKAADLAADAIDAAFNAGDFSEARFLGYEKQVRAGTKVFWSFIDAFYNRDFLKQMVTSRRRPLLQSSITSLLAGDIFNPKNQLITYLTGEGGAFADNEVAQLLG